MGTIQGFVMTRHLTQGLAEARERLGGTWEGSGFEPHYVRSTATDYLAEGLAMQWSGSAACAIAISAVMGEDVIFYRRVGGLEVVDEYLVDVMTLEGPRLVRLQDWIVWDGLRWHAVGRYDFEHEWEIVR